MVRITKIPDGEKVSEDFAISINGLTAKAYAARVSAMPFNRYWPGRQRPIEQTEQASFLTFTMDEPVRLELTASKEFHEAVIRPKSRGILPEIDGKTLRFTIEQCGQYTVELDGVHHALHIFANPEKDFGVSPDQENVVYFPPGVHHSGMIHLKSNQTLYIDQDAVVYGAVLAVGAENIRILGYGILDGSWEKRENPSMLVPQDFFRRNPAFDFCSPNLQGQRLEKPIYPVSGSVLLQDDEQFIKYLQDWNMLYSCIHLYGCSNCEINGLVLRDSPGFTLIEANCTNAVCDNIKLIGMWRYNSDGIDIFNSRNCSISNSFLRNFDDCVVLKGIPGWDTWNMENILVENCVLWCDWGRSLEIGAETCAPYYRNIIFRDCDCIHNSSVVLDIQCCDRAEVHQILYEDIRVEYSHYDRKEVYQHSDDETFRSQRNVPQLIYAGFGGDMFYSNDRIKGNISRVTFRNIQVLSDTAMPSVTLEGYDAEHMVSNVTIESLTFNGEPVTDPAAICTNQYTSGVELH